jgi:hypothetical protein
VPVPIPAIEPVLVPQTPPPPVASSHEASRRSRPLGETPTKSAAPLPAERPAPAIPPAVSESPLLAEGRSFSEALSRWHRDRNAQAALATLDAHDRHFGDGQMRLEARLLRAEIVLSLGRDREALAILDAVPLTGLPRERELRTVRGELRIKHGRCAEGRADLSTVTATDGVDAFGARATRAARLCP